MGAEETPTDHFGGITRMLCPAGFEGDALIDLGDHNGERSNADENKEDSV